MRKVAGRDAVDVCILDVTAAPHDGDGSVGLDLGDAHDELLCLHLKRVDLVRSPHVDIVSNAELADQWQVSSGADLCIMQLVTLLGNCKTVGDDRGHAGDYDAAAGELLAGFLSLYVVEVEGRRHL